MRVLHVIPYYLPETAHGGPVQAVHGLCRALIVRGHTVRVLTTSAGPFSAVIDGVPVEALRRCPPARFFHAPTIRFALKKALRGSDVVHVHGLYTHPAWLAARLAHAHGIPSVLSPHGMLMRAAIGGRSHWIKSAWIRLIERVRFRRATAVHFSSALEEREYTALRMPARPSFVVPHGVDSTASRMANSGRTILFLGRLCWIKGLDRLLDALALLPEVQLVLAGPDEDGYAARLRAQALRLGISDRIRWAGYVDGAEKQRLLDEAALLVLPSYSENFGMVVLEAWAAGKPVVVTPEVGLADTVTACGGGIVSEDNPEALARTLKKLLEDPALCRQCGTAGREIIDREFNWAAVALRMETHYQQLIERHGRRK